MDTNDTLVLAEDHRKKLDEIVSQMTSNKESEDDISFVVNDFKSKYGTKTSPQSEAKKKCTLYIHWNGRAVGIRNPFYYKD